MYEELQAQVIVNATNNEPECQLWLILRPGMDRNRFNF